MKHSILIVLGGTLASLIAIPQMAASLARHAWPENNPLSETDEIRQTWNRAWAQAKHVAAGSAESREPARILECGKRIADRNGFPQ